MDNTIGWLQQWYLDNCNGDWEHTYNCIAISTLDNPGWYVVIALDETSIEECTFQGVEIERTEDDWIHCKLKDKKFKIACEPLNLLEALDIFRAWAVSQSDNPDTLGTSAD